MGNTEIEISYKPFRALKQRTPELSGKAYR